MEMTEFIMDWDDWIKLTPAEQAAVRQRYERHGSEALPGAIAAADQQDWVRSLTRPHREAP
jgi:hypothetical protein